jgi:hypothetical protein
VANLQDPKRYRPPRPARLKKADLVKDQAEPLPDLRRLGQIRTARLLIARSGWPRCAEVIGESMVSAAPC